MNRCRRPEARACPAIRAAAGLAAGIVCCIAAAAWGVPAAGAATGEGLGPDGHARARVADRALPATAKPAEGRVQSTLPQDPRRLAKQKARAWHRYRRATAARGGAMAKGAPAGIEPTAAVVGSLNQLGLTDPGSVPPDTTGAIGIDHYVEMVNRKIGVYARSNLGLVDSRNLADFVGFSGQNAFDPQIQWDPVAGRWFYVADVTVNAATDNRLAFGWSKTSNPADLTNGWCRFQISTGSLFDDYPKLGHSDDFILFGTNVFDRSQANSPFVTSRIWAISKPSAGETCPNPATLSVDFWGTPQDPLMTDDDQFAFTPVPANTVDESANGYVVSSTDTTNRAMVFNVAESGGEPLLFNAANPSVAAFSPPADVPQTNTVTTDTIDTIDARFTNAVAVDDPGAGGETGVWTQHTVNGSGGRSQLRWYEIIPATGTVRQQGTLSDPNHFVFNGAVSPGMDGGSAVVNYNVASASLTPELRARSREAGDTLGQLGPEITLGTSTDPAQDFSCYDARPACRWGDYAGASPDPIAQTVVWGSSQTVGPPIAPNPPHTGAHWRTRNFALDADADGGGNAAPIAEFTYSCAELDCQFVDASTDDGTIEEHDWDFDDGTSSSAASPGHTFPAAGSYDVTLTVTDDESATDDVSKEVTVTDQSAPVRLDNGVGELGSAGELGTFDVFKVRVPRNRSKLVVRLEGPPCTPQADNCVPDLDLYVRRGLEPTLLAFRCRPFLVGPDETCRVRAPRKGTWFVGVHNYLADPGTPYIITAKHKG